ncbi:MAG: GNAT superfamily N-acetyltransferase [Acidimicrobiales bacterium]
MNEITNLEQFFTVKPDPEEDNGYILAYQEETAMSTIYALFSDNKGHETLVITNMHTEPKECRSGGCGSVALEHLLEYADQCGYKKTLAAHTSERNRSFWDRHGFTPIAPRPSYFVRLNPKSLAT